MVDQRGLFSFREIPRRSFHPSAFANLPSSTNRTVCADKATDMPQPSIPLNNFISFVDMLTVIIAGSREVKDGTHSGSATGKTLRGGRQGNQIRGKHSILVHRDGDCIMIEGRYTFRITKEGTEKNCNPVGLSPRSTYIFSKMPNHRFCETRPLLG